MPWLGVSTAGAGPGAALSFWRASTARRRARRVASRRYWSLEKVVEWQVAVRALETEGASGLPPLLHLCGDDDQGQEDVAALAASQIGRQLFNLLAQGLAPA